MELTTRIVNKTKVVDVLGPLSNSEEQLARDGAVLTEALSGVTGPVVVNLTAITNVRQAHGLLARIGKVALERKRPIPLVSADDEIRAVYRFGHDLFIAYHDEARAIDSANSMKPEDWA